MRSSTILAAASAVAVIAASSAGPGAPQRRMLRVQDIFAFKDVADPRVSPDGRWVAYTVSQMDPERDRSDTDIHRVPIAGGSAVRLTTSDELERSPRWSPDGRYLAFLSDRDDDHTQVWLLDTGGGEAVKLTRYRASVSWIAWSPDSRRLALVVRDSDPDAAEDEPAGDEDGRAPEPIVITRSDSIPTQDGESAWFLLEDGGNSHLARVPLAAGTCRSRTPSSCTRRSGGSAATRCSSSIQTRATGSAARATRKIVTSATWRGMTKYLRPQPTSSGG